MNELVTLIIYYAASVIAVIAVLVPHEFAHALAAQLNGDPTPKINGRLTLNPIRHFDPIGFVMCALVGFGWAKPVPINSANFKKYKIGLFTTAIAGIVLNYIGAFVFYPLYKLCAMHAAQNYGYYFIEEVLRLIYSYNLYIAVFNLLPLFPLDGFRIIEALTKPYNKVRLFLKKYGQQILMALILESIACRILSRFSYAFDYLNILGYLMQFAVSIAGWPIKALWGLVL